MRLDTYDNLNGSVRLAWDLQPGAASYNVYLNGVLNQNVSTDQATVTGLTQTSYSNSAVAASSGNTLRPQNMPPMGLVTSAGTYVFWVTAIIAGVERIVTRARTVTPGPFSIMLKTPMKRVFPYPNTGSPDG